MASGDTSSIKTTPQDSMLSNQHADAQQHDKDAVHHSLLSDAYNFVTTHVTKKEAEIAVVTAVVGGTTLALRHYMPAPVAEKITASGASILERTLGVASAPNAMRELKVLDAPDKVESLIARLRRNEVTSDVFNVRDSRSGANFKLLTGHSPIAPEVTAGADRIATCDLPAGCESKSIFAQQKGPVFLNFDRASQTLAFSDRPEALTHRIARFLQGDTQSWVPLGTQPSTDLRALATDRAIMPTLENANAAKTQAANPAREIVSKWESQQRIVNHNADSQDYMSNLIRNEVLPDLKRQGLIDPQWKFVSTQISSASDRGGADGIFVHEGTGQAHLVDFSGLDAKKIRPIGESPYVRRAGITERTVADEHDLAESVVGGMFDKKIPSVRTQGLIGYSNRWFDTMGKLDVENPEAAEFKKDLAQHLTDLTHAPAFFTAGKTPFADILQAAPETQIKQLEALKQWSLKEAIRPDSLHPQGYREYAQALDKSINFVKATFVSVGDTTHFNTVVQKVADQTIFRWALNKVSPPIATEGQAAARGLTTPISAVSHNESNVRFVRERSILSFEHDGLNYSSGVLTGENGVLDKSRRALLQEGRVKQLFDDLKPKQKTGLLARLGTPGKPASEEKAIREIERTLINYSSEIKAGGQLGMPQRGSVPPLIERIHERLQIRTVDTLTRPMDVPGSGLKPDPKNLPRMQ
jgi:hypothetical protein